MTLEERTAAQEGLTTGFDYLRIGLALFVLVFHSLGNTAAHGTNPNDNLRLGEEIWASNWRFIPAMVLPIFFSLSGYLIVGSLQRNSIHHFLMLRALRLIPALIFETLITAIIIGFIFTTASWKTYVTSKEFWLYFGNIVGWVHFCLPGVFEHNPNPEYLNGQLWTIPFELKSYASLVIISSFLSRSRLLFLLAISAACVAFTVRVYHGHPVNSWGHAPGRMLVLSFLAGVAVYFYRDTLPYAHRLGFASGVLAAIFLDFPNLSYLASLPIAYFTVWLGIANWPKIKFGDLSYGIYLFHYPVQQTLVATFIGVSKSWPLLALLSLPISGVCAWVSWNFVESPVLHRKLIILRVIDERLLAPLFLAFNATRRRMTSVWLTLARARP